MKALILGCGSIGQRHVRNLVDLGIVDLAVFDPDEQRTRTFLDELGVGTYCPDRDQLTGHFDLGLVCSPTSLHVPDALWLSPRCTGLFIEKPLSHSLDQIDELLTTTELNHNLTMMAMCYRFNSLVGLACDELKSGAIGTVFAASVNFGQSLPTWHPTRNYRTEYAARSDLGGGVCLTTGSHVIDLIRFMLGEIKEVNGFTRSTGELGVNIDDVSAGTLKTTAGLVVGFQFDFLQIPKRAEVVLCGSKGRIRIDFVQEEVYIERTSRHTIGLVGSMTKMYQEELQYFVDMVKSGKQDPSLDVRDGLITLKRILELRSMI